MSSGISGVSSEIDPTSLSHPTLAFLKTYWDRKRGSKLMPPRSEIRPAEMKQYVRALVLVDALPGFGDFRYRTVGTDVTELMFAQATGQTVRNVFAPLGQEAVDLALGGYRKVAEDHVALRAFGSAAWLGLPHMDFDSLHLPLSDDGITVNMIISAATFTQARHIKS
ncbi:MAG: PAS domain-containing protein [Rhizomicrobium sp.]